MVGLVNAPVELAQRLVHVAQILVRAGQALEVVTRFGQRIDVTGIPGRDAPVGDACDEEMLRFDADVKNVTGGAKLTEDAAEIDAGTESERLPIDVQLRGEARQAGYPRRQSVGGWVDAGHHVVRGRILAHAPNGPAGETGAAVRDGIEHFARHHFHLGRSVNVHELDKEVLHAVFLKLNLQRAAVHIDLRFRHIAPGLPGVAFFPGKPGAM